MILWQHTHVRAAILCNTSTSFGIHHVEGAHGVGLSHLSERGWQSCSSAARSDLIDMC